MGRIKSKYLPLYLIAVGLTTLLVGRPRAQPSSGAPFAGVRLFNPRTMMASAVWGRTLFLFGGDMNAAYQSHCADAEAIDFSKPIHYAIDIDFLQRDMLTAQAYGPYVFLFGGGNGTSALADVERIDMRNLHVAKMAPLPTARRAPCSVLYNGKIYVIGGGFMDEMRTGTMEIYDIAANKWSRAAGMPTPRECTAFVHGNKIYAVGGYQHAPRTGSLRAFEEYDIAKNTWTKLKDIPYGLSANRLVALGDDVFSFGSYDRLDRVCAYSFKDGRWRTLTGTGYVGRRHAGIGTDGKRIIVAGGNDVRGTAFPDVQYFDVAKLRSIVSQTRPD